SARKDGGVRSNEGTRSDEISSKNGTWCLDDGGNRNRHDGPRQCGCVRGNRGWCTRTLLCGSALRLWIFLLRVLPLQLSGLHRRGMGVRPALLSLVGRSPVGLV